MFPIFLIIRDQRFLVNHLKMSISKKNFFFDIKFAKKMLPMLNLLYSLRIVRRYLYLNSKILRIFPYYISERSLIKSIRFFQKKTPLKLSIKSLKILATYSLNSHLILSTPKGLKTHQDALQSNLGGSLVCLIL